jgi:pyruvate/2-oxoglutarate dehydrogenase complex dihydrolipoamide dehydrogenase (E3) component
MEESRRLLSAQILAPEAGEMTQAAVLAIHNRMTIEPGRAVIPVLDDGGRHKTVRANL